MTVPDWLRETAAGWLPVLLATVLAVVFLVGTRRFLAFKARRSDASFGLMEQLLMLVLTGAAVVAVILALPIGDAPRGQLLSLLGLLLTAAIALASTTFIGNAMAGMMLRAIRHLRPGDFVRVGEHFGRVSEQGLLHTEIQTEDRDLTTLPNLHLVTNPVTVVRASGTVLSATVSLGYDIPRGDIETCLLAAARKAELEDPFVRILELGDFSVTYRIAGMLRDVKVLLSSRSRLRACVLDALHAADIEIVSPSFMNQRVLSPGSRIAPTRSPIDDRPPPLPKAAPETRIFDKAEEAEAEAKLKEELAAVARGIEETSRALENAQEQHKQQLESEIRRYEARRDQLEAELQTRSVETVDPENKGDA